MKTFEVLIRLGYIDFSDKALEAELLEDYVFSQGLVLVSLDINVFFFWGQFWWPSGRHGSVPAAKSVRPVATLGSVAWFLLAS